MESGKALSAPLPPYVKLCLNDCPKSNAEKAKMAKVPYSYVCDDMYMTKYCFCSGSGQSQYMSNPGKKHWEAVKGVMRYLNGTKELCICVLE